MSTIVNTTTATPTKVTGIFNEKGKALLPWALKNISNEVMRILFFGRITQIELSLLGKSEFITDEMKQSVHEASDAIRKFDMKTRSRLDKADAAWLSKELCKEKMFDIAQITELAARISDEDGNNDYTYLMSMMVQFLDRSLHMQAAKKRINIRKYKALFKFFTEEMIAETENGQTAVEFNEETDTLSFRLVQPDAQIPAKPSI
jgi:hypothetical protein